MNTRFAVSYFDRYIHVLVGLVTLVHLYLPHLAFHQFCQADYHSLLFFFFFQAEDGIRDLTVTGVQTCALPILSLVKEMSVGENIFLGREPRKFGVIRWEELYRRAQQLLDNLHLEIDPHTPIRDRKSVV